MRHWFLPFVYIFLLSCSSPLGEPTGQNETQKVTECEFEEWSGQAEITNIDESIQADQKQRVYFSVTRESDQSIFNLETNLHFGCIVDENLSENDVLPTDVLWKISGPCTDYRMSFPSFTSRRCRLFYTE